MGTLPRQGQVEVLSRADPTAVWDVVADVTRVGEWSHECHGATWVEGAIEARPGARFRGTNRVGRVGWSRTNEVVTADRPHTFAWRTVPTAFYRDSTRWTITCEPVDGGTRIVQRFEVLALSAFMARLIYLVTPAHRDRSAALRSDLERLGALAEQQPAERSAGTD